MPPFLLKKTILPKTTPKDSNSKSPKINAADLGFLLYGTMIFANYSYAWIGFDSPNTAITFRINDCFSQSLELVKECTDNHMKLVKIEKKRAAILVNKKEAWLEITEHEPSTNFATAAFSQPKQTQKRVIQPNIVTPSKPVTKQKAATAKKPPVATKPQGNAQQEVFQIQRVWVDEQLANFGQILQDARVIPEIKEDKTLFKFDWIKEDSMYSRLGLKEGDIILTINDIIIDNISKAMGLLNKLQSERQIALEVERDGQLKVLQYFIN